MTKQLVILGSGGHAKSLLNVARALGYQLMAAIDPDREGETFGGQPVVASTREFEGQLETVAFAIGVGSNPLRELIFDEIKTRIPARCFPALIHPSAVVSDDCEIGPGSVLMPNSTIGPSSKIGLFCIINHNASLDHDGRMGDFSSLAPGAHTGGDVSIGTRSAVSIGASIKQGVSVGSDSVIGANAYLDRNMPDNVIAYGTPGRIIRLRDKDDPYLG